MARTHQRSLRIEDEHIDLLDSLPRGTVNTFINELIRIAKTEPEILKQVTITDERFNNWKLPEKKPGEMVDKMVKPEAKVPQKSALPVKPEVAEIPAIPVNEPIPAIPGAEVVEPEVDGAAEFDKALAGDTPPAPAKEPAPKPEPTPVPTPKKSALDDLFPGMS